MAVEALQRQQVWDRSERLERTMSKHGLYQRYRAECDDPVSEGVFTRMLVDLRVHKAKHPDFAFLVPLLPHRGE